MLDKYITACHSLVVCRPDVGTDCNLAFEGPVITPRDKCTHLFENCSFLSGLGTRFPKRKISDKKVLEDLLYDSADPVGTVMSELQIVEEVKRAFGLDDGMIFEKPPHAICDTTEDVVRHGNPSTPPSTPRHTPLDLMQLRADQTCISIASADP
ncbi:hypothetical protein GCG54_00015585 [Colletotrichum gloeosporioides]|uniref:Uncharacterized protein n=1 Tax=Colletotrichum gloeosporioides TaxID=474922 RepID=A0A8H4CXM2_COLGL|nr:uncharacterized protein GCG54_00015585 [Colletotrichum gloeosporioides]KAF3812035.1 hypothetical protein GCG54_00015585 [Colletotrichum gloeosporioides]